MPNISLKLSAGVIIFFILNSCIEQKDNSNEKTEIQEIEIRVAERNKITDSLLVSEDLSNIIILKDTDNFFQGEPGKILVWNKEIFCLDRTLTKSIVRYSKEGKYLGKYGNIGQGPGEYLSPWDIFVDSIGVYVLDPNLRKVIKYDHEGNFNEEFKLSFYADAFYKMKSGKFIFNLIPEIEPIELLITDDNFKPEKEVREYSEGYKGGVITNNIFHETEDGLISYYRIPLDYILEINNDGEIIRHLYLDFGDKNISESGRNDYINFLINKKDENPYIFMDSPINFKNLIIGGMEDDNGQFTIIYDKKNHKTYCRKRNNNSLIKDIINPVNIDKNGKIISLLNYDMVKESSDYDELPDSIRNWIETGSWFLTFHNLK